MADPITIQPLTRIEGHGKITIHTNEDGMVEDAQFHVPQFRGFEKLCEGRPFREMPALMSRICGICPVAHLIAGAKACDQLLAVQIPPTGVALRKVINLGQVIQSHALSFFYLSSPDLVFGMDAEASDRNIFGVHNQEPQLARDGIQLRKFGQRIIEELAGQRIHPTKIIAGGVSEPCSAEARDQILSQIPEMEKIIQRTLDWFKTSLLQAGHSLRVSQFRDEIRTFGNFDSLFLGLVNKNGELDFYDGSIRVVDGSGHIVADHLAPEDYQEYIGEKVENWSYLKFPYYKPYGYPEGMYRVGPLARLNLVDRCGTPRADLELKEFRDLSSGAVLSSFYYHYARLIEILYALEKIEELLSSPDILDSHVKAKAGRNNHEGVGVAEAPRGTLFHHYITEKEHGIMKWANLIIATGNNNLAMNKGVMQVAKHFVNGRKIEEGALNRVEAVIRAFDPCLSCSTHAAGQMPLRIELYDSSGEVQDVLSR